MCWDGVVGSVMISSVTNGISSPLISTFTELFFVSVMLVLLVRSYQYYGDMSFNYQFLPN